jgi:micrococcal nuclease
MLQWVNGDLLQEKKLKKYKKYQNKRFERKLLMYQSIIARMLTLKKFFFIVVFLSVSLSGSLLGCLDSLPSENGPQSYEVMVTRVIDGDTIVVSFPNQTIATIRLLGIDCPETSIQNNKANEYQNITNLSCLTFYGIKAKLYVASLINNSQITITFDNQTGKKDLYGRYLCYVSAGQININARLLEEGYARVYTLETFSKKSDYLELQRESIASSKGLWNCSRSQKIVTIDQVHYNADGNDEENLNDEYVVLVNSNAHLLDLTGWSIQDENGNVFDFPIGFTLHPFTSVTVYTGQGSNMTTALYWHHDTPVWNNDGDTVFIYNEKQLLIETFSW